MKKSVLGKGFGSLLPEGYDTSVLLDKGERVQKISINEISPDPEQPRKNFDSVPLEELTQSIKRYGILQPIVITRAEEGKYVIIAGERRFRAAKKAGLTHIPSLVRSLEDLEKLEVGLIENVQRVDLTPLEQAVSIARLNEQFNISYPDIAKRLGKAHTTIVNTVRLLQLPEHARSALQDGKITEGHARAVLSLKNDKSAQKYLVERIIKDEWSVRKAEAYVKKIKSQAPITEKVNRKSIINEKDLKKIENRFKAKVNVSMKKNSVRVQLNFKSNKDYTQFLNNL